jgi:hypothetical protein
MCGSPLVERPSGCRTLFLKVLQRAQPYGSISIDALPHWEVINVDEEEEEEQE